MPTLRPDKGGRWLARVVLGGKQIACKMFPPGKKFGPQWRAAKKWEEEQLVKALQEEKIRTDLEMLMAWGNDYLSHAQQTMSRQTYVEKQLVMREFFDFCGKAGIQPCMRSTPRGHIVSWPRFMLREGEMSPTNIARIFWRRGRGVLTS